MAAKVPSKTGKAGKVPRALADPCISVRQLMDWLKKWVEIQTHSDLWELFAQFRNEVCGS